MSSGRVVNKIIFVLRVEEFILRDVFSRGVVFWHMGAYGPYILK
jgi:hypothetical protein